MRYPIRRLPKQQGLIDVIRIGELSQLEAKTRNLFDAGVFGRKLEARSRRDAIIVMAHPALSLFEYGI
jgi:hypothetical protein